MKNGVTAVLRIPLLAILALAPIATGLSPAAAADKAQPKPDQAQSNSAARKLVRVDLVGVRHDGKLTQGQSISSEDVRDLKILVTWNLPGLTHVQRLELFTPGGALYQVWSRTFESVAAATTVETVVPVGGTWITENALFGHWRVDVYLDRDTVPTASEKFHIRRH